MRLLDLHIDGFGKFHDRDIAFEDGINVIYGKNEAGKSTLHTFIRGMLFGIEKQRGRASTSTASTSPGSRAEPTRDACGCSAAAPFTASSGRFRRTARS